jgi:hypothetical protein
LRFSERLAQQFVSALAALQRFQIIRFLEIDRTDLGRVNEIGDINRLGGLDVGV